MSCVICPREKSRCNRDDEAIPEELDGVAEFILSGAEGNLFSSVGGAPPEHEKSQ